MLNYCSGSLKVTILLLLLAVPSIFAYGNRPEDYSTAKKAQRAQQGGNDNDTPVMYWTKLDPSTLNQGRKAHSSACFNPSTSSGLFTDCRPFQSQQYPADFAVCRCSKCNQVSFQLVCFEGTWYLHPDVVDFPCDNCDVKCNSQQLSKFQCSGAWTSPGTIAEERNCQCLADCSDRKFVCSSTGNWVAVENQEASKSSPITCSAQQKHTISLADKNLEYHNGLIRVFCKDNSYKTQGHNVVACKNGQLNATIPQCAPYGDIEQGYVDVDYANYDTNPSTDPSHNNNSANNPSGGNNNPWENPSGGDNNSPGGSNDPWNNPSGGNNNGLESDLDHDGTLLHLPTTPKNPKFDSLSGNHPTSSSVTSNQPKGRDFNYLYVLWATLAILIAIIAGVIIYKCVTRQKTKKEGLESGVASGNVHAANETHGSYAAKK